MNYSIQQIFNGRKKGVNQPLRNVKLKKIAKTAV
jgi:hypothetical protein